MDFVVAIIVALAHWRLFSCLVVGIVVAIFLACFLKCLNSTASIFVVVTAFAVGLLWQNRADSKVGLFECVAEPSISKPVKAIGLSMIGFIWGGWFVELMGSLIASAVVLLMISIISLCVRSMKQRQPVSSVDFIFPVLYLWAGYVSLIVLSIW